MRLPSTIGIEPDSPDRAYLPYPVAVAQGIPRLDEMPTHSPVEAALRLSQGHMPEAGGLIDLRDGKNKAAYDLVVARFAGNSIEVSPASKDAVADDTDKIVQPGLITLYNPQGLLKVVGVALPPESRPWLMERRRTISNAGVYMLGLEARIYEIDEISNLNIIGTEPKRLY